MNAQEALAELTELSSQIEAAVVLDPDGSVDAATDEAVGQRLADAARELLATAARIRPSEKVTRVDVALPQGSVFVVREGERSAAALTIPEPTAGLVLYDLRTCLRRIDAPKPRRGSKAKDADA
jgi:predicted regulator of Ras-like GTPase activity (Roadblock/LC7/MglB family)